MLEYEIPKTVFDVINDKPHVRKFDVFASLCSILQFFNIDEDEFRCSYCIAKAYQQNNTPFSFSFCGSSIGLVKQSNFIDYARLFK